jgi:hypothetical protein
VAGRRRWVGVVDGGGGGGGESVSLFVDDTQIERRHLPTLDLDMVGHSTDSAESVPA